MSAPIQLPDLAQSERIRRYARGELSGEELQAFERKLLGDELLQDQVEAEFTLRAHAYAIEEVKAPAKASLPLPAIAASLVLGLAAGWFMPRPLQTSAQQIESVSFTLARGSASTPQFAAKANRPIAARFLTANDGPHQLQVLDRTGAVLSDIGSLLPDSNGDLVVLLPALAIEASPLLLRVRAGDRIDEYALLLTE